MTMANRNWVVGGASARGAAHQRRGTPNQDAIDWLPRQASERRFVAAVSDGHGARVHVHSQIGAQLAVESAAAVLDAFLAGDSSDAAARVLPRRTLGAWRDAVAHHVSARAGADEWIEPLADKLVQYGATLIAIAASENVTVALQIGDGDLFLGYPDGRIERPLSPDEGLIGEQTYSLCAPDALTHFRIAVLRDPAPMPDFAMLATDGVSKSFADETQFRKVVAHYRHAMLTCDAAAVLAPLPDWLASVSQRGTGDDVTLCLAARRSVQ